MAQKVSGLIKKMFSRDFDLIAFAIIVFLAVLLLVGLILFFGLL